MGFPETARGRRDAVRYIVRVQKVVQRQPLFVVFKKYIVIYIRFIIHISLTLSAIEHFHERTNSCAELPGIGVVIIRFKAQHRYSGLFQST